MNIGLLFHFMQLLYIQNICRYKILITSFLIISNPVLQTYVFISYDQVEKLLSGLPVLIEET
jgi:hypothetical protein